MPFEELVAAIPVGLGDSQPIVQAGGFQVGLVGLPIVDRIQSAQREGSDGLIDIGANLVDGVVVLVGLFQSVDRVGEDLLLSLIHI